MTVTRILSLSNLNKNITRRCWNSRLSVVTLQEKVAMRKVKGAFLTIVMFFSMLVVHASNYCFVPLSKPFDHIAQRLNTLDRENRRSEASPQDLRMLFNLAGNNAQLKARALFWEVRMAQLDKPTETCIKQLKKQRSFVSRLTTTISHSSTTNWPATMSGWDNIFSAITIAAKP